MQLRPSALLEEASVYTTPPAPRSWFSRLRAWWRNLWRPRTIRAHLTAFFGPDYDKLETHDKNFPGYDIASLNLALTAFLSEACAESNLVGGCGCFVFREDVARPM